MIKLYQDDYVFPELKPQYTTNISIADTDTFGAASAYDNACCLNFASHKRPGGGYESVRNIPMPINTQEEDIFRRSNLPEIMDTPEIRKYYPLMGLKGLYCDEVLVTKNSKLVPVVPFATSIVTVPAVVNPQHKDLQLVTDKIKRILEIAAENNHKVLILGAWGCGVFNNDPQFVSGVFKNFLNNQFQGVFETVVYAIPGKHSKNYQLFEQSLGN